MHKTCDHFSSAWVERTRTVYCWVLLTIVVTQFAPQEFDCVLLKKCVLLTLHTHLNNDRQAVYKLFTRKYMTISLFHVKPGPAAMQLATFSPVYVQGGGPGYEAPAAAEGDLAI